jgi:hypothetical protein
MRDKNYFISFFLTLTLLFFFVKNIQAEGDSRKIKEDEAKAYKNNNSTSFSSSFTCTFEVSPDLPLLSSSTQIEEEINQVVAKFSDRFLGTSAPTSSELSDAISKFNNLNIRITNGVINGKTISDLSKLKFLKTFASHLKFNPSDLDIKVKANNTVWWAAEEVCSGSLDPDTRGYDFRHFGRPAILLGIMKDENGNNILTKQVKELFEYTLYLSSEAFEHYWEPHYDETYQIANGAIDTDQIYNRSTTLMAYSLWQETPEERYQYMSAFKRYLERFFSYTSGTSNGIKPDGSGYHHWTAYNNYMYAYRTACENVYCLDGTSFQVDESSYKVFRDAVMVQLLQANDYGFQALSTCGRKPQERTQNVGQEHLKILANAGGNILGLTTADPILAGLHNRIYFVDQSFNYDQISPFEEGFIQLNHASAGVFRNNDWIAYAKGFTDGLWGTEIYPSDNRYGRYQSYGALEILYPGSLQYGIGFDDLSWDWNYNPGTTSIRLPWEKLHAERGRIDEHQKNGFAGSLTFRKKEMDYLNENYGGFGMFAMDFQELENQGFSTVHSSNNHNGTFTFKKSNFFFDDIIVCLGSGISNDDANNNTITTLYQRLNNKGTSISVNGANYGSFGEIVFDGASNNWLLGNYKTGFYLFAGDYSLKVKKESQQNPNHNQIWPVDYSSNSMATYYTGYIDHGVKPSNKNYEYILKPNSSITEMEELDAAISSGNKPYVVHQKDDDAHVLEHIEKDIFCYAIFNGLSNLGYDHITKVNNSCLIMSEYNTDLNILHLALTNPDLGFSARSFNPAETKDIDVTLKGNWRLTNSFPNVQLLTSNNTETVLRFSSVDGLSMEVMLEASNLVNSDFQNGANNNILVYPNPAKKSLNILSDISINSVDIYDLQGRKVHILTNELNRQFNLKIDIGTLSSATYLVKITTDVGVITKKIIIE